MYSIGVDVGGTGIKIGVVDESGNILYRGNCVTDVTGGFDKIISDIYDVIEDIIAQNDIEKNQIKSIGFGIPGYIDRYGKANCVNLNWKKVDFIQKLKETFPGTDIFAENDATVAGLAESRFGSTKEHDTSVMITLGTGVGGAIIIHGKPFSGAHGVGSEIGHMMIGDGWAFRTQPYDRRTVHQAAPRHNRSPHRCAPHDLESARADRLVSRS